MRARRQLAAPPLKEHPPQVDRLAQLGAVIGLLGLVLAFMGLFPGTLGLDPTEGIGVLQISLTLIGFGLLDWGAYIYVKATWFRGKPYTLGQTIAIRLTLTGLLIAAAAGLADLLGFGTHAAAGSLLGPWQAAGFVFGIVVSALAVVIFALSGDFSDDESAPPTENG